MPLESLGDWLKYIETLRPNENDFSLDRIRPLYQELIEGKFAENTVIAVSYTHLTLPTKRIV